CWEHPCSRPESRWRPAVHGVESCRTTGHTRPRTLERRTTMTRSSNPRMFLTLTAATALILGLGGHATAQQPVVHLKTVKVGELDIFYREAGPKDAPAILLLQGFPTSSQMFRNLIPLLATEYRVVAPDYPGYGHSSMPTHDQFAYTF